MLSAGDSTAVKHGLIPRSKNRFRISSLAGNKYSIDIGGSGEIGIMDLRGRLIKEITLCGTSSCIWDASGLSDGIYIINAVSDDRIFKKQVLTVR